MGRCTTSRRLIKNTKIAKSFSLKPQRSRIGPTLQVKNWPGSLTAAPQGAGPVPYPESHHHPSTPQRRRVGDSSSLSESGRSGSGTVRRPRRRVSDRTGRAPDARGGLSEPESRPRRSYGETRWSSRRRWRTGPTGARAREKLSRAS